MAKILVADDNSNIQKMVGLALKDQGIDVVAVGNGEAAVRKISDVRPDLVLADVFMPVRNGYEVCKYVKDDSALSHIPVILLVGAFDPLDEQEAQRVGADGVLKKPFVPPDPLISMVKSALTRAGVSVNGAAEKKGETAPAVVAGADLIAPRASPAMPAPAAEEDPMETVPRPSVVKMDSGAPVAFGSLLETPAAEEQDDTAFIAPASPAFAEDRNWGGSSEKEDEEEAEEEESPRASWRRDGGDDEEIAASGDGPGAVKDWRDSLMAQTAERKNARETWEVAAEKPAVVEAAETEAVVQNQETAPVNGAASVSTRESSTPFVVSSWGSGSQSVIAVENETKAPAVEELASSATTENAAAPSAEIVESSQSSPYSAEPLSAESSARIAEPEPVKQAEPDKSNSWFSTAPSPWEAEVKKASQLASAWDAATQPRAAEPASVETKADAEPQAMLTDDPNATQTIIAHAEEAGLPESAVETIREEAAEVAETADPTTHAAPESAEPKMDDLVAKVLAKMSPEVLQAVTREILKPVVEALVRDELKK